MKAKREFRMLLAAGIVAGGLSLPVTASADDAPRSYAASPGNYKVIAEDAKFRVILATWKPGQRDEWHSHAPSAIYVVNDCGTHRVHTPDGKISDKPRKAGDAMIIGAVHSHAVENNGTADCSQVIFEPK